MRRARLVALVGLLVLGGLAADTISPSPAGALYSVPGGSATARDVNGRLVTVTVTVSEAAGLGRVSQVHAWRQVCPGCGWESIGSIGWFLEGTPSLSLAADGRLELIGTFRLGGQPSLRVVRETCAGCGFASSPPLPPETVAAAAEPFAGPPPPVGSEDVGAATNPDGRRELFTTAGDGGVWHSWEWCPGCGWSVWEPLGLPGGGAAAGSPAVAANADGRLEVFVRSDTGALWHTWQWCGGGCGWSGWWPADNLWPGAAQTEPGLGLNADGRLEVFTGIGDVLHHSWQECPGCGWSPWVPVDGSPSVVSQPPQMTATVVTPSIAVARNLDGRLEVFFESVSGTHHVWQECAGCWWGPTVPLAP